jgi:hypothetical protein
MPNTDSRLGHRRRRQVVAQVRAEEPYCHLCGYPIDLTRDRHRDPLASCIDELTPRAHGGDPLNRHQCRHAHRWCNGSRGTRPITPQLKEACRAHIAHLLNQPTPRSAPW